MAKLKKNSPNSTSRLDVTRISRTLFFFSIVIAIATIVFDSGNLLGRDAVIDRWALASAVFLSSLTAWYIASIVSSKSLKTTRLVVGMLTLVLIAAAGYMTYWERGMASTSTIFYVLPLLTVATIKHRHALMATAALSAATYAFSAVLYFNSNFNEGLRIQLWGTILLYSGTIFVAAWLLMITAGLRKDSA